MESIVHASVLSLIDEYRNLLLLLSIELVFAVHLFPWRAGRRMRIGFAILALVAFGFLAHFSALGLRTLTDTASLYTFIVIWYLFAIAVSAGLVAFLFQISLSELTWLLLTACAAHHLVYVLVTEILFTGVLKAYYTYPRLICVYIPVAVLIGLLIYRLFRPILTDSAFLTPVQHSRAYAWSTAVFFLFFTASTFVNMHNALAGTQINYLATISDASNCLFVIIAQYAFTLHRKTDYDRTVIEAILQNEKTQYEAFRRSVDYISFKAHDLRHEIQAIASSGGSEQRIREISGELDRYDSFLQTGNDTLNIILSDKTKSCQALGIDLICMADAHLLGHVEDSDMYSLFGNMVENAIEYVSGIGDPEYRYIRLTVKPTPGGTMIQAENYLAEDLELVNGLPETSKGDTHYHGFGLKSIRFITEKYGGQTMISTEDHVFAVSCMIPVAQEHVAKSF